MTSDVIVRDARPDERGAIADLLSVSYEQYFPSASARLPELELAALEEYRADIVDVESRVADSDQIVAEVDGRLLGAVTFYPPARHAPDEVGQSGGEHWPAGWASFRLLGVHPDARGRGIGRMLTNECIRRALADGAPVLALHTTSMMAIARDMYIEMGWKRAPEHDLFPTPGLTVEGYTLDL